MSAPEVADALDQRGDRPVEEAGHVVIVAAWRRVHPHLVPRVRR